MDIPEARDLLIGLYERRDVSGEEKRAIAMAIDRVGYEAIRLKMVEDIRALEAKVKETERKVEMAVTAAKGYQDGCQREKTMREQAMAKVKEQKAKIDEMIEAWPQSARYWSLITYQAAVTNLWYTETVAGDTCRGPFDTKADAVASILETVLKLREEVRQLNAARQLQKEEDREPGH